MSKKAAFVIFGHLRTYKNTYESLFKHVVKPNEADGWEFDFFAHTWSNEMTFGKNSWYKYDKSINAIFEGVAPSEEDHEKWLEIYKPKKYLFEPRKEDENQYSTRSKAMKLCEDYEKESGMKYDFYFFTRYDVLFTSDFRLDFYLDFYKTNVELKWLGLPEKFFFIGSNLLRRMPVADPRYNCESAVFWAGSFLGAPPYGDMSVLCISLKYKLGTDFYIWRSNDIGKKPDPLVEVFASCVKEQGKANETLGAISKKRELELTNLRLEAQEKEQNIKIKKLEVKKLEKELGMKLSKLEPRVVLNLNENLRHSAVARVRNHLAYRLGAAIIICNKSFFTLLSLPFVLSFIKNQYKKEQNAYQALIKQKPEFKLPAIENYADYQAALKEKECLTYKLGEAIMRADKTWLSGGYIRFYFEAKRLEREFKNNKD